MENNFAFIDSQNLNLGTLKDIYDEKKGILIYLGWKLDFEKFRIYLKDKYHVNKAFLCIGYVPSNQPLYIDLQKWGYICIFKPTLEKPDGRVKGNVDAEVVLHSMIEYSNYDKAVIVSGDGDFLCLAKYLLERDKLKIILAPNKFSYSSLLNVLNREDSTVVSFVDSLKNKLEKKW